ncbi:hypothetical protein [Dyadobacter alkalitolerans]|uniref:hypothetical protein n=1 Tax=Dyadobacter alkalitolerans TaxID=492736 RepID=UPI00040D1E4D|nr:hypothetical protein [Dyadobacter alkalitolerans]
MKKIIYALLLPLVVVSGLVFANRKIKNEVYEKSTPNSRTDAERKASLEKWKSTPDAIRYEKWKVSAEGRKVYAGEAKIRKHIKAFTDMEATVTALSLPAGSRLGFGVMVRINDEDYILSFGPQPSDRNSLNAINQPRQLHSLKISDKINIRSRSVSHAPKYLYPIISGDYVERDGKVIYKRAAGKGGC